MKSQIQTPLEATNTMTPGKRAALGLALSLVLFVVSLFVFSPRYAFWAQLGNPTLTWPPEINRANEILRQTENPLAKAKSPSNQVIQWRLLFPTLAYFLKIPKKLFLGLPHLGALLVFIMVFSLVQRETLSWKYAALIAALTGTNSWFFVSTAWLCYFDSYYVLALIAVAFCRPRWIFVVSCLLVPHINERFILGLPLAMTIHAFREGHLTHKNARLFLRDILLGLALILPFVLLRLLFKHSNDEVSSQIFQNLLTLATLKNYPGQILEGNWQGFRFAWIPIFACFYFIFKNVSVLGKGFVAAVILLTFCFSTLLAGDLSRTAALFVPALIQGSLMLSEQLKDRKNRRYLLISLILLANYLAPAKHVLAQFNIPIYSFPTELHNFHEPPLIINSKKQLEASLQASQTGDLANANKHVDHALRLAPQMHEAYFQKAQLYEKSGELNLALLTYQAALKYSKNSPAEQQRYSQRYQALKEKIAATK